MSILTTVYGRVNADGSAAANGQNWWQGFASGAYAGAFCSQRVESGKYQVMFAPGTFFTTVSQRPALVVTADKADNTQLRSARIISWNAVSTSVGGKTVTALRATIHFMNASGNPQDTSFDFAATGPLGHALTMTIKVSWNEGALGVVPQSLDCDHPMTLDWVAVDSAGKRTTDFYITGILGLPSSVFGIPQAKQRSSADGNLDTALVWRAFNNCPDSNDYQYSICAVRGNQVALVDPRIRNTATLS